MREIKLKIKTDGEIKDWSSFAVSVNHKEFVLAELFESLRSKGLVFMEDKDGELVEINFI